MKSNSVELKPGDKVNFWTILSPAEARYYGINKNSLVRYWLCKCDCGTVREVSYQALVNGKSKSCGCQRRKGSTRNPRPEIHPGDKFGKLTVLSRAPDQLRKAGDKLIKKKYWLCQCECGNTKEVCDDSLKTGSTKSCGCLNRDGKIRRDITGHKFNHLTALEHLRKNNLTYWRCRCDCGNIVDVFIGSLLRDKAFSCGCVKRPRKPYKRRAKKKGGPESSDKRQNKNGEG